jgi:hypothetical protein
MTQQVSETSPKKRCLVCGERVKAADMLLKVDCCRRWACQSCVVDCQNPACPRRRQSSTGLFGAICCSDCNDQYTRRCALTVSPAHDDSVVCRDCFTECDSCALIDGGHCYQCVKYMKNCAKECGNMICSACFDDEYVRCCSDCANEDAVSEEQQTLQSLLQIDFDSMKKRKVEILAET